jgi:pantoate--beta-alanine ligase
MKTIVDPIRMQETALTWRDQGLRVGLVPTMGFLHRGHTSLMDLARPLCDRLVVSIFVNPLQFGPDEDLDCYPRDPDGDAARCQAHGTDVLFMPTALYPPGHATRVTVRALSDGLCGTNRPTHFEGVTTVVARLFGLVQPHIAVFGEKDYQQLAVIRRMTRDLALPIEVIGGPLVRDTDGVALSSRNKYLTKSERVRARTLSGSLRTVQAAVRSGERHVPTLLAIGRAGLDADEVDYLDIRSADELAPIEVLDRPARVFGAARYRHTRLIDNMALPDLP